METWQKAALVGVGAGAGLFALSAFAKPQNGNGPQPPPPPLPRQPAPMTNPSFEDGLNGWSAKIYVNHPSQATNSPNHLIETSSQYATSGTKSLHMLARKVQENSRQVRNVYCEAWQDMDLNTANVPGSLLSQGNGHLLIDVHGVMDFDAVEAPWGGYYAGLLIQAGNQVWHKVLRGTYNETVAFDLGSLSGPTKLWFWAGLWDQEPQGSTAEMWVDNIGVTLV